MGDLLAAAPMYAGFLVGVFAFLLVGLFHPLVVCVEYRWGRRAWWVFVLVGACSLLASMLVDDFLSLILGGVSGGCFWGTLELFWQHKRACRGRARRNPHRPDSYYELSEKSH